MSKSEVVALAKTLNLSITGNKYEIAKRIQAAKYGESKSGPSFRFPSRDGGGSSSTSVRTNTFGVQPARKPKHRPPTGKTWNGKATAITNDEGVLIGYTGAWEITNGACVNATAADDPVCVPLEGGVGASTPTSAVALAENPRCSRGTYGKKLKELMDGGVEVSRAMRKHDIKVLAKTLNVAVRGTKSEIVKRIQDSKCESKSGPSFRSPSSEGGVGASTPTSAVALAENPPPAGKFNWSPGLHVVKTKHVIVKFTQSLIPEGRGASPEPACGWGT
jgi:hypothetical protein